jgi:hypothetical protein
MSGCSGCGWLDEGALRVLARRLEPKLGDWGAVADLSEPRELVRDNDFVGDREMERRKDRTADETST